MEIKVTLPRLLILIVLVAVFWIAGGFDLPHGTVAAKSWSYMMLLYLGGAVCISVVDHWVGNLDRSNLRFLYIIFGILCCGGGLMYLHVLKKKHEILEPDHALLESRELFHGVERKAALD